MQLKVLHDKRDYITNCMAVAFSSDRCCPEIGQFLVQGHFIMQAGSPWDKTTTPVISGWIRNIF